MALIISRAFDVDIDKDVVRRVLAKHYRPGPGGDGPSWRTFFCHLTEGLWSLVLHRCKSLSVQRSRLLGVIAELTARLIDLDVYVSDVGQIIVNRITELLAHLRHGSTDHQLGFEFGPRHASPPIPEAAELSPLPYLARSPPLANSSIHTPSRELNETISSLTGNGLGLKLLDLCGHSTDRSARLLVGGDLPVITCGQATEMQLDGVAIRSRTHCHGLNELPLAA
jgi:hypothetical protein